MLVLPVTRGAKGVGRRRSRGDRPRLHAVKSTGELGRIGRVGTGAPALGGREHLSRRAVSVRKMTATSTRALVVLQLYCATNLSAIGCIENHLVLNQLRRFPRVARKTRGVDTYSLTPRDHYVRRKYRLRQEVLRFLDSHRHISDHAPMSRQLGVLDFSQLLPTLALAPCRVLLRHAKGHLRIW